MSNTLELTASSMASYQTSWYHSEEIIQGYYNNSTSKIYFGYCWFSSADLQRLRNTIDSSVQVEKVEIYFQRANTVHGSDSATAVQINNTTRSDASGTPSTSELSNGLVIGSFTRGQAKWCTINERLLNGLLNGQNGFCFYHSSATASGSWNYYVRSTTLPKIRITYSIRYSTITTNVDKVNFGSAITTTISPNDPTFSHTLTYQIGANTTSTTLAAGNVQHSFTVPTSWIGAIPDSVIGYMTISCKAYDTGGNLIGTDTLQVEVDVPSNVVPTAGSITLTINGDTTGWNVAIANKTTITASIAGYAGAYGSTITSYTLSGGNYSSINSNLFVATLEAGTLTVTGTVTDSRGRTATVTKNITVYDYLPPFFQSLEVGRCNSLGTLSSDGHYARIKGIFGYSSVGDRNTITCSVTYTKVSTGETYSAGNLTSGVTKLIGNGNLSSDEEYDVEFTLTDGLQSVTYVRHINSSAYTIHFKNGGRGVALGQAATEDETVRVHKDWHFYVGNNLDLANLTPASIHAAYESHVHSLDGQTITGLLPPAKLASTNAEAAAVVAVLKTAIVDAIYPVGSIYLTISATDPQTLFGGVWERIEDRFLLGASNNHFITSTGGSETAEFTIPAHHHSVIGSSKYTATEHTSVAANRLLMQTSDNGAYTKTINTMPPYLAVYMWKRIG